MVGEALQPHSSEVCLAALAEYSRGGGMLARLARLGKGGGAAGAAGAAACGGATPAPPPLSGAGARSTFSRHVGHVCCRWNHNRRHAAWNMWLQGSFFAPAGRELLKIRFHAILILLGSQCLLLTHAERK